MSEKNSLIVYITGVPGTGKTSIAKCISKELNLKYLEVNDLVKQHDIYLGYDINRDTLIVDDELLRKILVQEIKLYNRVCIAGGIIFEDDLFDLIILVHTSIPSLKKRLQARSYDENKIESNIEAEIMNVLYYELLEFNSSEIIHEVMNDSRTVKETSNEIISIIKQHSFSVMERFPS